MKEKIKVKLKLNFRDIADLIEGLDALSCVTKKDENPKLRKKLFKILKKLDAVDAGYYADYYKKGE